MADSIAGPVNQIKDFADIFQSDHQRRITPDIFIGKRHPYFALSKSPGDRAVAIW
jgi:hypothetical protein